MGTKEYNLIKTTVESVKGMKQSIMQSLGDDFDEHFFENADWDDDDVVEKERDYMLYRCKWLAIWANKELEKEKISIEFDETTTSFKITI